MESQSDETGMSESETVNYLSENAPNIMWEKDVQDDVSSDHYSDQYDPHGGTGEDNSAKFSDGSVKMTSSSTASDKKVEPVSVFVNNLPEDTRKEMLESLYPSTRIELPVNDKGKCLGYAVIKVSNIEEANSIVGNNETYPLKIGGNSLTMYIINQKQTDKLPDRKRRGERQSSTKTDNEAKKPRKDDVNRDRDDKVSVDQQTEVYIGNLTIKSDSLSMKKYLTKKLFLGRVFPRDREPIVKIKKVPHRAYQFAVFRTAEMARTAVNFLNGVVFNGRKLSVRARDNSDKNEDGEPKSPLRSPRSREPQTPSRSRHSREPKSPSRSRHSREPHSPSRSRSSRESPSRSRHSKEPQSSSRSPRSREPKSPLRSHHSREPQSPSRSRHSTEPKSPSRARSSRESPSRSRHSKEPQSLSRSRHSRESQSPSRSQRSKEPQSPSRSRLSESSPSSELPYTSQYPTATVPAIIDYNHSRILPPSVIPQPTQNPTLSNISLPAMTSLTSYGASPVMGETSMSIGQLFLPHTLVQQAAMTPPSLPPASLPPTPLPPTPLPPLHLVAPSTSMVNPATGTCTLTQEAIQSSEVNSEGWEVCVSNLANTEKTDLELFFRVQFILRGLCKANEKPIVKIKFEPGRNYQYIVFRTAAFAETCVQEFNGVTFKGSKLSIKMIGLKSETATKLVSASDSKRLQENVVQTSGAKHLSKIYNATDSQKPLINEVQITHQKSTFSKTLDAGTKKEKAQQHGVEMIHLKSMPPTKIKDTGTESRKPPASEVQMIRLKSTPSKIVDTTKSVKVESVTEKNEEYEVYFGNVPVCRPTEFLEFLKTQFRSRGLCNIKENPVKRLGFKKNRDFQYAVFTHSADAIAAVEEINNQVFKGNKIVTNTDQIKDFMKKESIAQRVESKATDSHVSRQDAGKIEAWVCPDRLCGVKNNKLSTECMFCKSPKPGSSTVKPKDIVTRDTGQADNKRDHSKEASKVLSMQVNRRASMLAPNTNRKSQGNKTDQTASPTQVNRPKTMLAPNTDWKSQENKTDPTTSSTQVNRHTTRLVPNTDWKNQGNKTDHTASSKQVNRHMAMLPPDTNWKSPGSKTGHRGETSSGGPSTQGSKPVNLELTAAGRGGPDDLFQNQSRLSASAVTADWLCSNRSCGQSNNPGVSKCKYCGTSKVRSQDMTGQKAMNSESKGSSHHSVHPKELTDIEPKPKREWTCPNRSCRQSNFWDLTLCRICRSPKPRNLETTGNNVPGKSTNLIQPGGKTISEDWTCPTKSCGLRNAGDRIVCTVCGAHKPVVVYLDDDEDETNDGVWNCPQGSCGYLNFSFRNECVLCRSPRRKTDNAGVGVNNVPAKPTNPIQRTVNKEPEGWICPTKSCGLTNALNRTTCRVCFTPKPGSEKSKDHTKSLNSVPNIVQPVQKTLQPVPNIVQPVQKTVQPVSNIVQPVQKTVQPVQNTQNVQKVDNCRVHLGNTPKSITYEELLDFILKRLVNRGVCEENQNPIKQFQFKRRRGFQFLLFSDETDAQKAVAALDGSCIEDQQLKASIKDSNSSSQWANKYVSEENKSNAVSNNLPEYMSQFRNSGSHSSSSSVDVPEEDKCKVFVGNLPEEISQEDLEMYVYQALVNMGVARMDYSPIKQSHFIPGRSFQYIEFHNEMEARNASEALAGMMIEGREIIAYLPSVEMKGENSDDHELFIGNLFGPLDNLKDFLVDEIVSYGLCSRESDPIYSIHTVPGRPFGFASFRRKVVAQRALSVLANAVFNGHRLIVGPAESRSKSAEVKAKPSFEYHAKPANFDFAPGQAEQKKPKFEIFIGNLNAQTSSEELEEFIVNELIKKGVCTMETSPVTQVMRNFGKPFGFASLNSLEACNQAVEALNGVPLHGAPLGVKLANRNPGVSDDVISGHNPVINVYIGNLPHGSEEKSDKLKTYLEVLLVSHGICSHGDDPIMFMKVFPNRPYQLAWFRSLTVAQNAISVLNGVPFEGNNIIVQLAEKRVINHTGNFFEVYVGNLPVKLTLKEFSTAIEGALIDNCLCRPEESLIHRYKFKPNRHFQYVVLDDSQSAPYVMQALRSITIGGNYLKIYKANSIT